MYVQNFLQGTICGQGLCMNCTGSGVIRVEDAQRLNMKTSRLQDTKSAGYERHKKQAKHAELYL